ncbi:MAG TPA: HAMP domain-containing sensor histidine kinase [Streptosporangiaceae bacterium]|nr:HAMP domain-containing sensor histidine kinase [Streptosporangiaceae bacterium]
MTHPATSQGLWRSARALPSRTPLRIKLIAAVLALVTAALAVISIAGIAFLRGYLLNQADQNLEAAAKANIPLWVEGYFASGRTLPGNGGFSVQWLPEHGKARQVIGEFKFTPLGYPGKMIPGPAVTHGAPWLATQAGQVSDPVTISSWTGHQRWRVISTPQAVSAQSGGVQHGTIVLGLDVTSIYRTINELTIIDLIVSCALLLVLTAVGITVIRRSMRPLIDIERTADAIAAGDLGRRVPERDPRTEVGKLGRSLNVMLAHIEAAFRARMASEEAARSSEEAARRSALNASRSEDRMRQFVADASHELRTPLTAIRGFAEYYRQRGGAGGAGDAAPVTAGEADDGAATGLPTGPMTSPELDRLIERVEGEAKRMGVLVDDMLLLARLDQQRTLDYRTVDLLAIAADALHDARVIAPKRTINLTVGTTDAPLVTGDEVGLRQVVSNLMSNAMTHTPDGTPIEITIKSGALGNGHGPDAAEPAVVLEVTDHGAGLTKEQQEHVFERFYRTDRARTRTAGGTGLGLAIVSAMVSAHHGQVWVDSDPGQGATFGFALPLAPEARAAAESAASD